jgi:hypothetical protein
VLVAVVSALLVLAALHDARAKKRGTYRTAAEWEEITSRRKSVGRELRRRRPEHADSPDADGDRQQ